MRTLAIIAVFTVLLFVIPFWSTLRDHIPWDVLQQWQTLLTGISALVGAIIAFIAILLQINAQNKVEQKRVMEEKDRAVSALAIELQLVRDLILHLQSRLDQDAYEARAFYKSLPSDFPIFHTNKNNLGRLNRDTALLVYRAYSILQNVIREVALDAEHDPTGPIHYDPDGWPGSELSQFCKVAQDAITALEAEGS